jgi:hypothetical protein
MPRPKHRGQYSDKHLHKQRCWYLLVYYRTWPWHYTSATWHNAITTCETIVIKRNIC